MKAVNAIIAILAILALELAALNKGIDGIMLAGGIAIIAGLGGYVTGHTIKKNSTTKKQTKKKK